MSAIRATWKKGQVQLDSPGDWPEGRRLMVVEDPFTEIDFMTEAEQSDDPEAIEKWIADLRALPAMEMSPEQEGDMIAWRKTVKEFNLEAMRRQMEGGIP